MDDQVQVLKGGVPAGTDHSKAGAWPKTLSVTSYGAQDDTWGLAWTPADLRASGFGLSIGPRFTGTAGNDSAHIDSVTVTVFFTVPCGG